MPPSWSDHAANRASRLNAYQRAIYDQALSPGGPNLLRVLAGAGSGKTNTVTTLLMNGLNSGVLTPATTIVTTFTNKAAGELKERVAAGADPQKYAALDGAKRIGTFHSIGLSVLRTTMGNKFSHGWNPNMNLDIVPDRWDRGDGYEKWLAQFRNMELDAHRRGLPSRAADMFKKPHRILDDVVGPPDKKSRNPSWKTDIYQIPGLPLDIPTHILRMCKEQGIDPPERMPGGREYALAMGIVRSYGLHPTHTPKGQVITITDPADEDQQIELVGPEAVADKVGTTFGLPLLWKTWGIYEKIKESIRAYDFEDVLYYLWVSKALTAKLVIVDEAQDMSWVQLQIAREAAERGDGRFIQVGDIRQAIYSFRGANPAVMRDSDDAHGFTTLEIPTNYRSGESIVALGGEVCYSPSPLVDAARAERASWSPGQDPIAARRVDPTVLREVRLLNETLTYIPHTLEDQQVNRTDRFEGKVRHRAYSNATEEAQGTAGEISSLLAQGVPHKDMAILVRTNAEGAFMEMGLLSLKVPVIRIGRGVSFFDTRVISSALKWVEAAYGDEGKGVDEVLQNPDRGVFMPPVRTLLKGALRGKPAREILRYLDRDGNANKFGKDYFQEALYDLEEVKKKPWPLGVETVIEFTFGRKALEPVVEPAEGEEALPGVAPDESDHEALQTLLTIAHLFPSYEEFKLFRERLRRDVKSYTENQIAQLTPEQRIQFDRECEERVIVSSIHGAKGLEWGWVWLSSSQGVFPSARSSTKTQQSEERRLFYVAVTRAKDVVTVTSSYKTSSGKASGPSEFVETWVTPHIQRRQAPRVEAAVPHPLDIPGWVRTSTDPDAVVWTDGERVLELLLGGGAAPTWGIYWSYATTDGEDREIESAHLTRFATPAEALPTLRTIAATPVTARREKPPERPLMLPLPPLEWLPNVVDYLLAFPTRTVGTVAYAELAARLAGRLPAPVRAPTPAPRAATSPTVKARPVTPAPRLSIPAPSPVTGVDNRAADPVAAQGEGQSDAAGYAELARLVPTALKDQPRALQEALQAGFTRLSRAT